MVQQGWFNETLMPKNRRHLGLERASLIMVDCDIYSATREALAFYGPLIKDRAVFFFDD